MWIEGECLSGMATLMRVILILLLYMFVGEQSCRKVGILMVTRRLYVRRSRKKKSNIPDSEMQHLPESLPDGIDYLVIT